MNVFLPQGCNREQRVFVLGRIVLVDAHVASACHNPYRLTPGTRFHVCHVEPLTHRNKGRTAEAGGGNLVSALPSPCGGAAGAEAVAAFVPPRLPGISYTAFASGDLALFLLGNKQRNIWMAFHSSRPYHFLSDVSLSLQRVRCPLSWRHC